LGNWPDYRTPADGGPADGSDRSATLHAWCHGSPGIGLARAASLAYTDDPDVVGDLEVALRSWQAARAMANHSLCHGELGNLEMLTVVRGTGRDLAGVWDERVGAMLDRFEAAGPVCGTPGAISTPGLMVGLAGIGHGLLRLGFPDLVPSVLLLDPPAPGRTP
jgi:lantibiotic modifying enzyme